MTLIQIDNPEQIKILAFDKNEKRWFEIDIIDISRSHVIERGAYTHELKNISELIIKKNERKTLWKISK